MRACWSEIPSGRPLFDEVTKMLLDIFGAELLLGARTHVGLQRQSNATHLVLPPAHASMQRSRSLPLDSVGPLQEGLLRTPNGWLPILEAPDVGMTPKTPNHRNRFFPSLGSLFDLTESWASSMASGIDSCATVDPRSSHNSEAAAASVAPCTTSALSASTRPKSWHGRRLSKTAPTVSSMGVVMHMWHARC
eukprot:m.575794 g.575794  ORF g.575794 m.575794 type:complete len:192 (+) comp22285_c0_seq17:1954-2529(+)